MSGDNIVPGIFALSALVLGTSFLLKKNKESFTAMTQEAIEAFDSVEAFNGSQQYSNGFGQRERFGAVEDRQAPGPDVAATKAIETIQDQVKVNTGSNVDDINKLGAQYYSNLQNYLNPSMSNLQLAQNISSAPNTPGGIVPGAASSYADSLGNGFVDNLGYLDNKAYPSVSYANDRAAQLSQCAKDLPMFAASSLLPKPSANADNNAISQSAARALAAFTALSPIEQIGAITSINTPYSKTSDIRAIDPIPQGNMQTPLFNSSPSTYVSTTFGQVNNTTNKTGPSGLSNAQ